MSQVCKNYSFILGWNPFVTSWIETRDGQVEKANLTILFDKYIPTLQDAVKYRFKKITPIPEICHIQTLCRLLECLIVPQNIPSNDPPKVCILKVNIKYQGLKDVAPIHLLLILENPNGFKM